MSEKTVSPKIATAADLADLLPSIEWLWPSWLPRGFVTLLVGVPGVGKSMTTLALARSVIEGAPWPDGEPGLSEPGLVLWADCESAQALLNERITNWGLPADRILLPGDDPLATVSLSIKESRAKLRRLVQEHEPAMLVIDSLGASHGGNENSTRDMGNVLGYLARLARDCNIAVPVIHHLRKKAFDEGEEINLDRVRGSSVITSFARSVIALERIGGKLRLSVAKSNLAKLPDPLGVVIGDEGLTFGDAPERKIEPTRLEEAVSFLKDSLADGPRRFKDLEAEAREVGISKRQLYKAQEALHITTVSEGWKLPGV